MLRDVSAPRFPRRSGSLPGAWLLIACCSLAGCGVHAYEERLNNANELFDYQNRLDQVLAKTPWAAPGGYGISMRIPLGYAAIPAPAPSAPPAEGEPEPPPPVDLRQPTYLGVPEIEGLIGAWKAVVPTRDNQQAQVFLYVFGNHDRILHAIPGEQSLPSNEYLKDLESVLQMQLGVTLGTAGSSANQVNVKLRDTIPRVERFVKQKEFQTARLVPTPDALAQLQIPESAAFECYLYEHQAGPCQVALLLVAPVSVRDNPEAALRTALETLTVSDQPPRRQSGSRGAPSGQQAF